MLNLVDIENTHSFRFIFFREGRNSGRKSPKAKEKGSYSIFFKAKYSWIRAFFVLITKYEHRYLPYFWFSPIRYRKNLRKTSLLLWSTKICSYLLFTLRLRCSFFFERKWLFLFEKPTGCFSLENWENTFSLENWENTFSLENWENTFSLEHQETDFSLENQETAFSFIYF